MKKLVKESLNEGSNPMIDILVFLCVIWLIKDKNETILERIVKNIDELTKDFFEFTKSYGYHIDYDFLKSSFADVINKAKIKLKKIN